MLFRSFWPVVVSHTGKKVAHADILRDRDQIWAEAYYVWSHAKDTWWAEFENDETGALAEQEMRSIEDPLATIVEAALAVSHVPQDKHGNKFVTFHWLLTIAQNANIPPSKKTLAAVSDAITRLGGHRKQIYRTSMDIQAMANPCRDGSMRKIVDDQFPEGVIPDRLRVYFLKEGDD